MLLYDVFYWGRNMDAAVRLPEPNGSIRYAASVNGERERLQPRKVDGKWQWADVTRGEGAKR